MKDWGTTDYGVIKNWTPRPTKSLKEIEKKVKRTSPRFKKPVNQPTKAKTSKLPPMAKTADAIKEGGASCHMTSGKSKGSTDNKQVTSDAPKNKKRILSKTPPLPSTQTETETKLRTDSKKNPTQPQQKPKKRKKRAPLLSLPYQRRKAAKKEKPATTSSKELKPAPTSKNTRSSTEKVVDKDPKSLTELPSEDSSKASSPSPIKSRSSHNKNGKALTNVHADGGATLLELADHQTNTHQSSESDTNNSTAQAKSSPGKQPTRGWSNGKSKTVKPPTPVSRRLTYSEVYNDSEDDSKRKQKTKTRKRIGSKLTNNAAKKGRVQNGTLEGEDVQVGPMLLWQPQGKHRIKQDFNEIDACLSEYKKHHSIASDENDGDQVVSGAMKSHFQHTISSALAAIESMTDSEGVVAPPIQKASVKDPLEELLSEALDNMKKISKKASKKRSKATN